MSLEQTIKILCAWCEKDGVFNIKDDQHGWNAYIPQPEQRQEFYSCFKVSHGICPSHYMQMYRDVRGMRK